MKAAHDPIAELMHEHDEALVQLKLLNKAVTAISRDGYSSAHMRHIATALRYINKEVNDHNHREEEALFPVLERYVEGPTRILRNDHKELRKGFAQLSECVRNLERNRDSFSRIKRLAAISKRIIQLFVNHIHKENYILFPLVQRFLTTEELREIAKTMI